MTSSVASSRLLRSACLVAAAAWHCRASCCWAACWSFALHMTGRELQCRTMGAPHLQKTVYLASSDCLRARWSLLSCMCRASASPADGACMAAAAKQPSAPYTCPQSTCFVLTLSSDACNGDLTAPNHTLQHRQANSLASLKDPRSQDQAPYEDHSTLCQVCQAACPGPSWRQVL